MTNPTLEGVRAGDEDAFRELTEPFRRELQVHIYRIDGSAQDAEDLLQETLLAARRGLAARGTGVGPCLAVADRDQPLPRAFRATRRRPQDLQRMTEMPKSTRYGEAVWLEPFPDVLLEGIADQAPSPEARYETKEAIELGFIVGLQHLRPGCRGPAIAKGIAPKARTPFGSSPRSDLPTSPIPEPKPARQLRGRQASREFEYGKGIPMRFGYEAINHSVVEPCRHSGLKKFVSVLIAEAIDHELWKSSNFVRQASRPE